MIGDMRRQERTLTWCMAGSWVAGQEACMQYRARLWCGDSGVYSEKHELMQLSRDL